MKLVFICTLFVISNAQEITNTAHGYLMNYGVPLARKIKESESTREKAGVVPGNSTKFPWEAGIIIDIIGIDEVAVCSATIVTIHRLVSAAHCWVDGVNQAWRYTVVMESTRLFSGGVRIQTHAVVIHPSWTPKYAMNDISIIQIPPLRSFSKTIAPIALPYAPYMQGYFLGDVGTASGFGIGGQEIGEDNDSLLNHVDVKLIDNKICSNIFPNLITPFQLCTSGYKTDGACGGDGGGPLTLVFNNRTFLVGVVSYSSIYGCAEYPTVNVKVTSFQRFLDEYLYVDILKQINERLSLN